VERVSWKTTHKDALGVLNGRSLLNPCPADAKINEAERLDLEVCKYRGVESNGDLGFYDSEAALFARDHAKMRCWTM
jgi:hypothetical protein